MEGVEGRREARKGDRGEERCQNKARGRAERQDGAGWGEERQREGRKKERCPKDVF